MKQEICFTEYCGKYTQSCNEIWSVHVILQLENESFERSLLYWIYNSYQNMSKSVCRLSLRFLFTIFKKEKDRELVPKPFFVEVFDKNFSL